MITKLNIIWTKFYNQGLPIILHLLCLYISFFVFTKLNITDHSFILLSLPLSDVIMIVLTICFCSLGMGFALPIFIKMLISIGKESWKETTTLAKNSFSKESGFILVSFIAGVWIFFLYMIDYFPPIFNSKNIYIFAFLLNVIGFMILEIFKKDIIITQNQIEK